MSYTDESVRIKLSALNETQESIVTVAQWIMFHRNHAPQTAQIWLQRLKDTGAAKRLNLIYLANEVVQQSKARKRDDFLAAFSPIIAEAAATAYQSAVTEVQHKLRRVIEVWRQREIFDKEVQEDLEARINGIDRARSSKKSSSLGGSLLSQSTNSSSLPPELATLSTLHATLSQSQTTATSDTESAQTEYTALTSRTVAPPTPPVHAARLSSLLKSLGSAHSAVTASLAARNKLLDTLQALVKTHQESFRKDEATAQDLLAKKRTIEAKKLQVEDAIMRGLSSEETAAAAATVGISNGDAAGAARAGSADAEPELERPDVEPLTPPPYESFTPPGDPSAADVGGLLTTQEMIASELEEHLARIPVTNRSSAPDLHPDSTISPTLPPPLTSAPSHDKPTLDSQPALDILSTTALTPPLSQQQQRADDGLHKDPRRTRKSEGQDAAAEAVKRRKTSQSHHSEEFAGFADGGDAMEGLDEDVVGMLG